jgi:hypothetical protein
VRLQSVGDKVCILSTFILAESTYWLPFCISDNLIC